jgi:glycosyltransferase involved in cell wall biosynthesis
MWFGETLSRLELLTLHSFTHFGHEFHLWAYDDLTRAGLPKGVVLKDATKIIPRKNVFAKKHADPETGVGRNSFGAPFSDLFRFKLLRDKGGIWVDMDVTCLRPLDFKSAYAFRPHRLGIVGSILKAPAKSALMRRVHAETARRVTPESAYLLPNRILSQHVSQMKLERFIVAGLSNPDSWHDYVRPMIEGPAEIPSDWYAIHWINEMWRTLAADDGKYRGRQLLSYVPDKNNPKSGSTLWELYRKYGLIDVRTRVSDPKPAPFGFGRPPPTIPIQSYRNHAKTPSTVNILIPSLVRGGAERAVVEIVRTLGRTARVRKNLFVLHRSRQHYDEPAGENVSVIYANDPSDPAGTMQSFGFSMLKASSNVVFAHLVPASQLKPLWQMGIVTIPVVQNMSPSWVDPPSAYQDPHVPFFVGVADAVTEELSASSRGKPAITIRHELQRAYAPDALAKHRRQVRDRHGIPDDALLVGMVGQFKSQKAYTRAVRVLRKLREHVPAKLMILGGWDHAYGAGRETYEATCRLAVELGVIADMITPGDIDPIDPYLAAFDVYLSTSVYEGLSVALLEAIQTGCPIVAADAGGTREVLPADAVLIANGADTDAYVKAILGFAGRATRAVPQAPADGDLVPRLWALLAKHGIASSVAQSAEPTGTLYVTQNLEIGGAQRSLVNLLAEQPRGRKSAVCTLAGNVLVSHKRELDRAGVPVFSADGAAGPVETAEFVLDWFDRLNMANLCFWNVNPETKLLLAKVLSVRKARLIDVSPGPMLFDELKAAENFQRRVSLGAPQYFERLDAFVAKYENGKPPRALCRDRGKIHVIPNGVRAAPGFVALPPAEHMLPDGIDRALAIGTCCRLVPDKQIEFLLAMMGELARLSPGASLSIIGGGEWQTEDYAAALSARLAHEGPANVLLAGPQDDVRPFLGAFQVFVMASDRQGCPNASLEAMSLGVPVVAKTGGGIGEQIDDGKNGFLVKTPAEMAAKVAALLKNKGLRRRLGHAAQKTALRKFSMRDMARRYERLLG